MANILGRSLFGILAYAHDNAVSAGGLVSEFAHRRTRAILRILQIATEKWTVLSAGVAKIWAEFWHGQVPSLAKGNDVETYITDSSTSSSSSSDEAVQEVLFAFATRKRDFHSVGLKLKAHDDKHGVAAKSSRTTATRATSILASSAEPAPPAASVASLSARTADCSWELSTVPIGPPTGQMTKNSCMHFYDWRE